VKYVLRRTSHKKPSLLLSQPKLTSDLQLIHVADWKLVLMGGNVQLHSLVRKPLNIDADGARGTGSHSGAAKGRGSYHTTVLLPPFTRRHLTRKLTPGINFRQSPELLGYLLLC